VIVEHNLDLVLAPGRTGRLRAGTRRRVPPGAGGAILTDLEYRKRILWL